jgi:hypothetical protein
VFENGGVSCSAKPDVEKLRHYNNNMPSSISLSQNFQLFFIFVAFSRRAAENRSIFEKIFISRAYQIRLRDAVAIKN